MSSWKDLRCNFTMIVQILHLLYIFIVCNKNNEENVIHRSGKQLKQQFDECIRNVLGCFSISSSVPLWFKSSQFLIYFNYLEVYY